MRGVLARKTIRKLVGSSFRMLEDLNFRDQELFLRDGKLRSVRIR